MYACKSINTTFFGPNTSNAFTSFTWKACEIKIWFDTPHVIVLCRNIHWKINIQNISFWCYKAYVIVMLVGTKYEGKIIQVKKAIIFPFVLGLYLYRTTTVVSNHHHFHLLSVLFSLDVIVIVIFNWSR